MVRTSARMLSSHQKDLGEQLFLSFLSHDTTTTTTMTTRSPILHRYGEVVANINFNSKDTTEVMIGECVEVVEVWPDTWVWSVVYSQQADCQ